MNQSNTNYGSEGLSLSIALGLLYLFIIVSLGQTIYYGYTAMASGWYETACIFQENKKILTHPICEINAIKFSFNILEYFIPILAIIFAIPSAKWICRLLNARPGYDSVAFIRNHLLFKSLYGLIMFSAVIGFFYGGEIGGREYFLRSLADEIPIKSHNIRFLIAYSMFIWPMYRVFKMAFENKLKALLASTIYTATIWFIFGYIFPYSLIYGFLLISP